MIDEKLLVRLQCDECLTSFAMNDATYLPITEEMIMKLALKEGWNTTPTGTHCPECVDKRIRGLKGRDNAEEALLDKAEEMRKVDGR